MVDEHAVTSSLEGQVFHGIRLEDVRIQLGSPLLVSVRLLAKEPLSLVEVDLIKDEVEQALQRPVRLEAFLVLVR